MSNGLIMSQEEVSALLGRPLTKVEANNFELYLQIAILRLNDLLCIELEEMDSLPADLKLLIARCFATIIAEQTETASHGITKKSIEDFSVSFDADADSPMVAFVQQNAKDIEKYGRCQGPIRSGGGCVPCEGCCYGCF